MTTEAETEVTPTEEAPKKRSRKPKDAPPVSFDLRLRPNRLEQLQTRVHHFIYFAPPTADRRQFLLPEFWAHCTRNLNRHSRITIDAEDLSWTMTLVVLNVGQHEVQVALLSEADLSAAHELSPVRDSDLTVSYGNPQSGWRVIRRADGAVIRENFRSRDEAVIYVKNRNRALAS